jgi:hypothetical protein
MKGHFFRVPIFCTEIQYKFVWALILLRRNIFLWVFTYCDVIPAKAGIQYAIMRENS